MVKAIDSESAEDLSQLSDEELMSRYREAGKAAVFLKKYVVIVYVVLHFPPNRSAQCDWHFDEAIIAQPGGSFYNCWKVNFSCIVNSGYV